MPNVLLLNPPSSQRVCRDLYCGHIAKGRYYWPQIDLLALSGRLHEAGCRLELLDGVVDSMSVAAANARIDAFRPDVVISLAAAITWSEDIAFLRAVQERNRCRVLVSGDFPRAEPARTLAENDCLDGVILDFADCEIADYVASPESTSLRNLHTRAATSPATVAAARSFDLPLPRHELYDFKKYHCPHVMRRPFTVVMTDFGCPYRCDYCPFERIAHKRRNLDGLRRELEYIRRLGIREFILQDLSFGAVRSHALEVCELMRSVSADFSWVCEFRADSADEELLRAMRAAGCHTLMIGVESPNEAVMAAHHKPQSIEQVERAFALARHLGFRTLAHFIIGLTGETVASIEKLIRFSLDLNPDIASYNVARPAWNTSFREEIRDNGWLLDSGIEISAPDSIPVWQSPDVTREQMDQFRIDAMRRFYLRPSYALRQLARVRTPYQLSILVREGFQIFGDALRSTNTIVN